jgi:2-oxoglutarate dehydrogenase complex dehydrogenase (E1) component-like enzyme
MGAWDFGRPSLEGLAGGRRLAVLARPRSSSPAEGSTARHAHNQARLIRMAFDLEARSSKDGKDATRPKGAKAGVS